MPLGMTLVRDPNFARVVNRFKNDSERIVGEEILVTVKLAAIAAKNEARLALKSMVYTAPLPPSAYRIWPDDPTKYLHMNAGGYDGRRTGRVWRATKTRTVSASRSMPIADMFIDQDDFSGFYYAWILNEGGKSINYPRRPFFTTTVAIMRARYKGLGSTSLGRMKQGLLGFSLPSITAETDL